MDKKLFLFISIVFVLLSAVIVSAITLTKDYTRLVVVPIAVSGQVCLWDSNQSKCTQDSEPIVFGTAEVYPTFSSAPVNMTLIVFRDNIYRSTGSGYIYYQENCRTIEEYDPVKGTLQKEVCDTTLGLKEEDGGGSLVTETGLEQNDVFHYKIFYNPDGSYKDLELLIGNDDFKLQNISSSVENITWEPK